MHERWACSKPMATPPSHSTVRRQTGSPGRITDQHRSHSGGVGPGQFSPISWRSLMPRGRAVATGRRPRAPGRRHASVWRAGGLGSRRRPGRGPPPCTRMVTGGRRPTPRRAVHSACIRCRASRETSGVPVVRVWRRPPVPWGRSAAAAGPRDHGVGEGPSGHRGIGAPPTLLGPRGRPTVANGGNRARLSDRRMISASKCRRGS